MKGNSKFGISILVIVIITIALIQAGQQTPIDWRKTYHPEDKIPFGTYVVFHELKNTFSNNRSFDTIHQSLYNYLKDSSNRATQTQDLVYIGNYLRPGKNAIHSLLAFVERGNNALLAIHSIPRIIQDTLKIQESFFNNYQAGIPIGDDSVFYVLSASQKKVYYDKAGHQYFFSRLDSATATILGYLKRDTLQLPNFIKVQFGKGNFFLQLTPNVYSNYAMLDTLKYPIAYLSLHHLNGTHLLWYDGFFGKNKYGVARTPLRVILSYPPLRTAWYLLLITLILFLIFKSKREQKAIPIVKPEKNLSVSFAETVGSLYYESGNPGNLIQKKINYFLYYLKREYSIDANVMNEKSFRKQAAKSLHLSEEDIHAFFDQLAASRNLLNPTNADLKELHHLIENFKQKI